MTSEVAGSNATFCHRDLQSNLQRPEISHQGATQNYKSAYFQRFFLEHRAELHGSAES